MTQLLTRARKDADAGPPARRLFRKRAAEREPESVPPIVYETLGAPGRLLDPAVREEMEARFDYDFRDVRVHTDAQAAESAQAVNAVAYTVGRDIAFAPGRYHPANPSGRALLAHELTHVIQQPRSPIQHGELALDSQVSAAEAEAHAAALALVPDTGPPRSPAPTRMHQTAPLVQRQSATLSELRVSPGDIVESEEVTQQRDEEAEERKLHNPLHSVGRFLTGIFSGAGNVIDEKTVRRLLDRTLGSAIFMAFGLPVFLAVFMSGVAVGVGRALIDSVKAFAEILGDPQGFVEQVMLFVKTVFGEPEAAHALGEEIGKQFGGQIKEFSELSIPKFAFELGALIGPPVVSLVVSLLGIPLLIGAAILTRLAGWLARFPRIARFITGIARRMRLKGLRRRRKTKQVWGKLRKKAGDALDSPEIPGAGRIEPDVGIEQRGNRSTGTIPDTNLDEGISDSAFSSEHLDDHGGNIDRTAKQAAESPDVVRAAQELRAEYGDTLQLVDDIRLTEVWEALSQRGEEHSLYELLDYLESTPDGAVHVKDFFQTIHGIRHINDVGDKMLDLVRGGSTSEGAVFELKWISAHGDNVADIEVWTLEGRGIDVLMKSGHGVEIKDWSLATVKKNKRDLVKQLRKHGGQVSARPIRLVFTSQKGITFADVTRLQAELDQLLRDPNFVKVELWP